MNATQSRLKQVNDPLGLSPAALGLPAQARTGRRAADSGSGLSSAVHGVTSVGVK